jgi:hypothetical protein
MIHQWGNYPIGIRGDMGHRYVAHTFSHRDIDIHLRGKDNARRYIFSGSWHYLPSVRRPSSRGGAES